MKKSIKEYLIEKNYSNAEILIRSGQVKINNEVVFTPSFLIKDSDKILIEQKKEFVSRGAYKLLAAIEAFKLDFENKVILDIGASTGGFSQVSLNYGAKLVYALDVGNNQLDYKLRQNSKIKSLEQTNLKSISKQMFEVEIDKVVCDVSFISLKEVYKVVEHILKTNDDLIVLLKPQFEASSKYVEKGGFVLEQFHPFLIDRSISQASEHNFKFIDKITSPIKGKKSKNTEYILWYKKT